MRFPLPPTAYAPKQHCLSHPQDRRSHANVSKGRRISGGADDNVLDAMPDGISDIDKTGCRKSAAASFESKKSDSIVQ